MFLALSGAAKAQQQTKVFRIGFLEATSPSVSLARLEAFRQGLRELGYVEGKNIVIEYRYAEGNFGRLPELAAELVRLKVDVIVAAGGTTAIQAAKSATSTIPIVVTATGDPVGDGLIASLARPGGNITGLSLGGRELDGKRLELLKETVPKVSRVAVFWYPTGPGEHPTLKELRAVAPAFGIEIRSFEVRSPNDFESVFQAATKGRVGALTVTGHPVFTGNRNKF